MTLGRVQSGPGFCRLEPHQRNRAWPEREGRLMLHQGRSVRWMPRRRSACTCRGSFTSAHRVLGAHGREGRPSSLRLQIPRPRPGSGRGHRPHRRCGAGLSIRRPACCWSRAALRRSPVWARRPSTTSRVGFPVVLQVLRLESEHSVREDAVVFSEYRGLRAARAIRRNMPAPELDAVADHRVRLDADVVRETGPGRDHRRGMNLGSHGRSRMVERLGFSTARR